MANHPAPGEAPSPEYLAAAAKAGSQLGRKCAFAHYAPDDIRQEAVKLALEAWPRYDKDREPGPYVYRHVLNRLRNLYRDEYQRNDPPCKLCHEGRHGEHPDGLPCRPYVDWRRFNTAKANVCSPADFEAAPAESEDALMRAADGPLEAERNEVADLIDRHLPAPLRPDYARLLAGVRLKPGRKSALQAAVRAILEEHAPSCLKGR